MNKFELKNARLYDRLEDALFMPEIERLKFAGATDKMVIDSFKDITTPSSKHCIYLLDLFYPVTDENRRKVLFRMHLRNCKMGQEYLIRPDRPTCQDIADKYNLSCGRTREILNFFFEKIYLSRDCRGLMLRNPRFGKFKKVLYERILDKVLENE